MGLRGGLLRAQRNSLYSLVSFGGGPSCGRRAGSNCACAPSHTHAGSDSVAAAAISPHAADPRNIVGRTSRGKRCGGDRKSTRLNSSHVEISYAVFCLKKKTTQE